MDPDLSLLEISDEDDSLLLQIPNDDASMLSTNNNNNNNGNNNNYFLCSPLQIHGSKRSVHPPPLGPPLVESKVGGENAEKPCSSLLTDGINKENINANKSEVPKLSMEPQQMKRRKKGGGYNLRKSLAWDRAFFTEKGVLDPVELSMISGGFSKVGEEMLPCIPEEGRESLSGVLDCTRDSADLQALEENLFKELSSSSMKKDRKRGGCLLPKHGSSARDNVSPAAEAKAKVLSAHEINRSGSKRSGCPRPVVSSSYPC
ncbi:uncharacterized protein LOC132163031 [Corylus avellana]|uniref:uncharacterized protein LOC132163031 n=1 Tax=Corylus avellana TaxID=13451 RepID=UPI00286A3A98|nr:uncharacterized protein LOC132163031 [Corylus avellana]